MARLSIAALQEQIASLQSQVGSLNSQLDTAEKELRAVDALRQKYYDELATLLPLKAENERLAKELKVKTDGYDLWYKKSNEADAEREQLHMIIDAVEGAPARYAQPEPNGYSTRGDERKIATRLAGTFIALAKGFAIAKVSQ